MKKTLMIIAVILTALLPVPAATLAINCLNPVKTEYVAGEQISIVVRIAYENKLCGEGIEVTKFFTKGMKIIRREGWNEVTPGIWENMLTIEVVGNRKGVLQLTVARRTDKESVLGTKKFRMKVNNG
jgi:hypothetical protein